MLKEIVKAFRQIVRGFGQTVRAFGLKKPLATVSFVKNNGLSLVYVFPKKQVTYFGGLVSDQACENLVAAE